MYCFKCGKPIHDDSVFCRFCGASQEDIVEDVLDNNNEDIDDSNDYAYASEHPQNEPSDNKAKFNTFDEVKHHLENIISSIRVYYSNNQIVCLPLIKKAIIASEQNSIKLKALTRGHLCIMSVDNIFWDEPSNIDSSFFYHDFYLSDYIEQMTFMLHDTTKWKPFANTEFYDYLNQEIPGLYLVDTDIGGERNYKAKILKTCDFANLDDVISQRTETLLLNKSIESNYYTAYRIGETNYYIYIDGRRTNDFIFAEYSAACNEAHEKFNHFLKNGFKKIEDIRTLENLFGFCFKEAFFQIKQYLPDELSGIIFNSFFKHYILENIDCDIESTINNILEEYGVHAEYRSPQSSPYYIVGSIGTVLAIDLATSVVGALFSKIGESLEQSRQREMFKRVNAAFVSSCKENSEFIQNAVQNVIIRNYNYLANNLHLRDANSIKSDLLEVQQIIESINDINSDSGCINKLIECIRLYPSNFDLYKGLAMALSDDLATISIYEHALTLFKNKDIISFCKREIDAKKHISQFDANITNKDDEELRDSAAPEPRDQPQPDS